MVSLVSVDEWVVLPSGPPLLKDFFILKTPWANMKIFYADDFIEAVEFGEPAKHCSYSSCIQPPVWMQEVENRLIGVWTHPLKFALYGTDFQVQVWKALCCIEWNQRFFYSEIAEMIGKPRATRAVANAIGANRLAGFVPCHRVLLKSGGFGGYRWGEELKQSVLSYEASTKKPILLVRWDL